MAKLKAPLFSLGAAGQLGKALVYFGWKGLDVVREYVVPSNPQTKPQQDQRALLTAAVTRIHLAQMEATHALAAIDIMAYALWASVVQSATTWFNQVVRHMINQQIAGTTYPIFHGAVITPGVDEIEIDLYAFQSSPDNAHFWYGTSKTALLHSQVAVIVGAHYNATIPNLTTGVKYFIQLRADAGFVGENSRSGIYYGVAG